ncbi:OmcA/MtrC family decaheme c-type cytochrome [Shewanella youngdeokensis]|uniref:OmcA/MtrC family decaheme c-type cytochrome n=1 Tax=Shewanella youngdeokensis TaxID=2999068 RepID=A0ABZ0K4Q7_9GAMM|nr:OmcA/MtrC family decaheme c-type cytochrome [Shewanella sp. DAU334]
MMKLIKSKMARLLTASAISMALSGCGGDDGVDGNPGTPGGSIAQYINTLNLNVTGVTYTNGIPTVSVFATNEEDLPVVGLQDLGVTAAQLTPQGATGAGNSAQWTRTARASGSDNFIDNQDGSYTFTFELSEYNADMTQRFNVYAGGIDSTLADGVTSVPRREIVADFDGQGFEAKYTKNIVSHDACTQCHAEGEPITTRHSGYYTHETCATCHTSAYGESQWNHLIHNIHNTAKSFEDKYGKQYTGEAAELLLQDNCKTCHVEPAADSDELTEWSNWTRIPTIETCSSCHTDIDFLTGQGHSQQLDNSNCVACHNASWTEELHTSGFDDTSALINAYGMNTSLVVNADSTATITISFIDSNSAAVDAATLLPKIQRIEATTNVGPNYVQLGYYGKDSLNLVLNGELNASATITDAGAISYTTKALSFGEAGSDSDTAFTFTGLSLCSDNAAFVDCDTVAVSNNFDDSGYLLNDYFTGMKADLAFATYSGEAVSMRHVDSVNAETCISCHSDNFEIHKGAYHPGFVLSDQLAQEVDGEMVFGVDGCVACHTPDGTYAGGGNQGALEMKLHTVHGPQQVISDCTQCHNDFNLDAFKAKGALATAAGSYTTPIAATCGSCHNDEANQDAYFEQFVAHAKTQGAIFNATKTVANDGAQLEDCLSCHLPTAYDHTQVKM